MNDLCTKSCVPCEGGIPALTLDEAKKLQTQIPDWQLSDDAKSIRREYSFKDFHHTMAFVNAVAWIAHREDHHPDLLVTWGKCEVRYWTHAIDGLSENDFICAAKVDQLLA